MFRIARRVAADRVISTVDPQARHGHKAQCHGFDGYKGHVAADPDSEIITGTTATDANSSDAGAAPGLLADVLPGPGSGGGPQASAARGQGQPGQGAVYGDAHGRDHDGEARFGAACRTCPLAAQCTTATAGRTITIGPHEAILAAARHAQASPAWKAEYKATRPKAERKIAHLMRRHHGGRRARVRGQAKVAADFALLAAAVNLARLAKLGVTRHNGTWIAGTS